MIYRNNFQISDSVNIEMVNLCVNRIIRGIKQQIWATKPSVIQIKPHWYSLGKLKFSEKEQNIIYEAIKKYELIYSISFNWNNNKIIINDYLNDDQFFNNEKKCAPLQSCIYDQFSNDEITNFDMAQKNFHFHIHKIYCPYFISIKR